jgi:uroporphyrinogen-III decarboxylase
MGRRFKEIFAACPKLSQCVHIFHPDLQGPMNVCEMLWGASLYVDFYDKPDLIKDFLSLITETYIAFMRRWQEIVPPLDGYGVHWSMLHRGRIMIRDDAATNFSPEMFEEFVRPYDQRLLDEFGGGGIHFCGRGDHFIAKVAEMPGVYAVNMTQPEHNDVETVCRHTVDKGINLIGLEERAMKQAFRSGRSLRGRAHCW